MTYMEKVQLNFSVPKVIADELGKILEPYGHKMKWAVLSAGIIMFMEQSQPVRNNYVRQIVAVFAFLVFISIAFWPTLYRYDVIRVASPNWSLAARSVYSEQLVRTNRITGHSEILTENGWVKR